MPLLTSLIDRLLARQDAIVEFGILAFRDDNLQAVLDKAVEMCALSMPAPYCKICRYRPETNDLLITAGFGWQPDIVGHSLSHADRTSPGGLAYVTGEPVICGDLTDARFDLPEFYTQHGIVSTVNVVIQGIGGPPYGILEIDSDTQSQYDDHDIKFLQGFANVVAEAVATAYRVEQLRAALVDKEILSRELQHRVRNNLHLIYAMLNAEAGRQKSEIEESFRIIARRVQALVSVYDHLLGVGMVRSLSFGPYLATLCDTLRKFRNGTSQLVAGPMVDIMVDLDTATAMGLAVAEMVTNSYKHAFPTESGVIEVMLEQRDGRTILVAQDNGVGMSLPPASTTTSSKSQGVGLVLRLVEQIGGKMEINTMHGTRYEITLPNMREDGSHPAHL